MWKKLSILLIVFAISCSPEKVEIQEATLKKLNVESAKDWFNANSTYSTRKGSRFEYFKPEWNKARIGTAKTGEDYVEIPLLSSRRIKWVYDLPGPKNNRERKKIALVPELMLVIFQKDGEWKENIKEIRYNEKYLSELNNGSTKTTFSGRLLLWSWSGELLGGSTYESGIRKYAIKPVSDSESARTEACAMYTECHWTSSCQIGEDYDPWDGYGVGPTVYGTHTSSQGSQCQYPTHGHGAGVEGCDPWELTLSRTYTECWPDGETGGSEGNTGGVYNGSFITALTNQISNKPFAFMTQDCAELKKWLALAKFVPDQSIINKLNTVIGNMTVGATPQATFTVKDVANVQSINDAVSPIVNMDYYSVLVRQLPTINGQTVTAPQFLEYIRLNINSFLDGKTFYPYNAYGVNDTNTWNSSNPKGAIMGVDILGPDATVITSSSQPNEWIFTTVHDPMNGDHPVSGNRAFGFIDEGGGSYTFYTRGVDRLTDIAETKVQDWFGLPFSEADALWNSYRQKIDGFVRSHGGLTTSRSIPPYRPDWNLVNDVLEGRKPMSSLSKDCP